MTDETEPMTVPLGHEVPVGKKVNPFTSELEDAAPLLLAPSPADQRRLSADTSDDRPLIEKVRERVATDTARNVDGHYVAVQETPNEDITVKPPQQHHDVPPTNTLLVQQGHPVAPIEFPTMSPSVVSTNGTPTPEPESDSVEGAPDNSAEDPAVADENEHEPASTTEQS